MQRFVLLGLFINIDILIATDIVSEISLAALGSDTYYGEGDAYDATCTDHNADYNPVLYQWYLDGTLNRAGASNVYSYTMTSTAVNISCNAFVGVPYTETNQSTPVTARGEKIKLISLSGPTAPTQDTDVTYTCTVSLSSAAAGETVVRRWYRNGSVVAGESGETYTITPPTDGSLDGDYSCEASVSSLNFTSNTLAVASVHACSSVNCNNGNCSATAGVAQCTCEDGYTGTYCDTQIPTTSTAPTNSSAAVDPCTGVSCTWGTCQSDGVSGTCQCHSGWTGTMCDQADSSATTLVPSVATLLAALPVLATLLVQCLLETA